MTLAAARKKLHGIIDHADAEKVFELLLLIENNKDDGPDYSEETMNMLRERSVVYLSGKSKNYTVEESMKRIKSHRQKNGL